MYEMSLFTIMYIVYVAIVLVLKEVERQLLTTFLILLKKVIFIIFKVKMVLEKQL